MPLYRVQLKQGKRVIVEHIEAKNLTSVKSFYNALSTMKLTEVLEVKYSNDTNIPIDDFNYMSLYKGILSNGQGKSKQIILHNIKSNVDENDIYNACSAYLEVASLKVDSIVSSLFKK